MSEHEFLSLRELEILELSLDPSLSQPLMLLIRSIWKDTARMGQQMDPVEKLVEV